MSQLKRAIVAAVALLAISSSAIAQRHVEYKWRGFYAVIDGSYGINLNRAASVSGYSDTCSAFALGFSSGYHFSRIAGVGVGVTYFADATGAYTQMPFFVELRSHYMRSRITPYSAVQVGWSIPVGAASEPPSIKITEGGLYFGLEGGARYAIDRGVAVGAHVGYKLLQSNKIQRTDAAGVPFWEDPVVLHMLMFGVNLYF